VVRSSAAAIANAFLDIQDADASAFPRIDPMKLQKLVFYAHAWWLAIKGEPLFEEDIQAWPWGPVIPSLYQQFRAFGRSPIVGQRAETFVNRGSAVSSLNWHFGRPDQPSGEVTEFLKSVWESHKKYTGIQLSNATHDPGEPWTVIRDQCRDLEGRPVIPNDLIRDVFRRKAAA
jgi:uncharacterized phage-associated protein